MNKNINIKRIIGLCLLIMMLFSIVGGVVSYLNMNVSDEGYITAFTGPYIVSTVVFGSLLLVATHFGWLGSTPKLAKISRVSGAAVVGGASVFVVGFVILAILAFMLIGFGAVDIMPMLRT